MEERNALRKTVKMETDTLDNQFQINHIDKADFIKLDTDGSELFILQGAEKVLNQYIFGLEIEVQFADIFEGAVPKFSDVDSYVRKQGFELWDIQRHYWKRNIDKDHFELRGQLIFGNAVYFKRQETFDNLINALDDDGIARQSKVLNAISICLLYGYPDYALEILEKHQTLFPKNELRIARETIKNSFKKILNIPKFKGKEIANLFFFLGNFLKSDYGDGAAASDKKLGNQNYY